MTDRERLINLMSTAGWNIFTDSQSREQLADYLLEHGVIVPPCKVGDTMYIINRANKPQELIFDSIDLRCTCVNDTDCMGGSLCNDIGHNACQYRFKNDFSDVGKTVFLTRKKRKKRQRSVKKTSDKKIVDALKTNLIRYEKTINDTYLQKNNTTGFNGVYKNSNGTYRSYIQVNNKLIYLGSFYTFEDAVKARKVANSNYLPLLQEKTKDEIISIIEDMRVEIKEEIEDNQIMDFTVVESMKEIFALCQSREEVVQAANKISEIMNLFMDKRVKEISKNDNPSLKAFLNLNIKKYFD